MRLAQAAVCSAPCYPAPGHQTFQALLLVVWGVYEKQVFSDSSKGLFTADTACQLALTATSAIKGVPRRKSTRTESSPFRSFFTRKAFAQQRSRSSKLAVFAELQ